MGKKIFLQTKQIVKSRSQSRSAFWPLGAKAEAAWRKNEQEPEPLEKNEESEPEPLEKNEEPEPEKKLAGSPALPYI